MSLEERLLRLEEKVTYLERHVTAQDKVMLELGDELARVRVECRLLRDRAESRAGANGESAEPMAEERPPHY